MSKKIFNKCLGVFAFVCTICFAFNTAKINATSQSGKVYGEGEENGITLSAIVGYTTAPEKTLVIENTSDNLLQVLGVTVDKTDLFSIESSANPTLSPLGGTSKDFKIKAKLGLAEGTYTANVTVLTDSTENDGKVTSLVSFNVKSEKVYPTKPILSINNSYTFNEQNQTATVDGYNPDTMNITGNIQMYAGTYEIKVTPKEKWSDNTTDPVTLNWTINPAPQNVAIGTDDTITLILKSSITSDEMKSKVKGAKGEITFEQTWSEEENIGSLSPDGTFTPGTSTGTGIAKVHVSSKDMNDNGQPDYLEVSKPFTIKIIDKGSVTISGLNENEEFIYDGTPKNPTGTIIVEGNKVPVESLEVVYEGINVNYRNFDPPKSIGEYKVTYKVPSTNTLYKGKKVYNFKIVKRKLKIPSLTTSVFEYTGSEIDIMQFISDYDPNYEFISSDSVTKTTNVSENNIVLNLIDESNTSFDDGKVSQILSWSIKQATPNPCLPTNLTGTVGSNLGSISLPNGWKWKDDSIKLSNIGEYQFETIFVPDDIQNYKTLEKFITVKVISSESNNITYDIIEGKNQIISDNTEAKFKINADFNLFKENGEVFVDGLILNPEDYTAEPGSTTIILKQSFLNTLSSGDHTLTVTFGNGGKANTVFSIVSKDKDKNLTNDNKDISTQNSVYNIPKTGDSSPIMLLIATMMSSLSLLEITKRK